MTRNCTASNIGLRTKTNVDNDKQANMKNNKEKNQTRVELTIVAVVAFSNGKRYATFVRLFIYPFLFKLSRKVLDGYRTNFQT